MKASGHELLSGAVGTCNEYPGVGRCHLLYHFPEMDNRSGFADHLPVALNLLLQCRVLGDDGGALGGILDGNKQPVEVQRLLYEVEGAFLYAFHGRVDVSVARYHDDCGLDSILDKPFKHLGTLHPRHLDVTEDGIILFLPGHLDGCLPVVGQVGRIAFVIQYFSKRVPDGSLVINNKNLHFQIRLIRVMLCKIHANIAFYSSISKKGRAPARRPTLSFSA